MPEKKKNFECQIVIKITLYTYINFLAIIFLPYCCVYTISLNTCAEELRAAQKKIPIPVFYNIKNPTVSCLYVMYIDIYAAAAAVYRELAS